MGNNPSNRVLNLNAPAGKMLAGVAVLGGGIPLLLYLTSRLLSRLGVAWPAAGLWIKGFIYLGLGLLGLFILLVMIEQIQDAMLLRNYRTGRKARMQYSDEFAECPYCGNRRLRSFEQSCPVCGKRLEQEEP
jgi:hypothetical protein